MAFLDNKQPGGGVHVLLIGVDDYQHLPDEGGGGAAQGGFAPGLTKLSCSRLSATMLADWFLTKFKPDLPLDSLDILVSGGRYADKPVPIPTFDNIYAACKEWRERCDHQDDIAILYFCGHGMEESSHFLLPEDIFDDPNDPTKKLLDLDQTVTYMRQCNANTQLFFIDACRSNFSPHFVGLRWNNPTMRFGQAALPPLARAINPRLNSIIYMSAPFKGAPALARTRQTSYFAEALKECLDCYGADRDTGSGHWVRIDSLREALLERTRRQVRHYNLAHHCFDFRAVSANYNVKPKLHKIANPKVQVSLCFDPSDYNSNIALELSLGTKPYRFRPVGPWETELDPGQYRIEYETLPAGKTGPKEAFITMPVFPGSLQIQP